MIEFKPDEYARITQFIQNVFNYYNGKINTVNYPARLIVDWAERRTDSRAGTTSNPDIVYIYPSVMARYVENAFQFYYIVITTIIHELYHVDQELDYMRIAFDDDYRTFIENATEFQALTYTFSHLHEINENFGLAIQYDRDIISKTLLRYSGSWYYRITYVTHILNILGEIYYDHEDCVKILSQVKYILTHKNKNLIVRIDNEEFPIMINGSLAPISIINDFFYNRYFAKRFRNVTLYTEWDDYNYYLDLEDLETKNLMIKVIDK